MIPTIDFSRSFLTFRIDTNKKPPQTASHRPPYSLNNARIQIECRCRVVEKQTGTEHSFILGANCKTERVGVPKDIWTEPNADFVPVFSDSRFLLIKTYARAAMEVELYPAGSGTQSERQSGRLDDAYDSFRCDLAACDGEQLTTAEAVVEATLENHPLVAHTEIETPRYLTTLEYPIKTMNANERDWIYQTDTGPVLLPNLDCPPEDLLEKMELAFAAFNCADWVEFIVRVPTKVGQEIDVYHFNQPVRHDARNLVVRPLSVG